MLSSMKTITRWLPLVAIAWTTTAHGFIRTFSRGGKPAKNSEQIESAPKLDDKVSTTGDKDKAFFRLNEAYDTHGLLFIRASRNFDSARNDLRYSDLLRQMRLPSEISGQQETTKT